MTAQEFWSHVRKGENCWIWRHHMFPDGYGKVQFDSKSQRAHRIAYTLAIGSIPRGFYVLHHCDNPICCRPDHLWIGSQRDNMIDMARKGRSTKGRATVKGEMHGRSKVTIEDVQQIRRRVELGEMQIDLAKEFGLSFSALNHIVRRKNWRHVP